MKLIDRRILSAGWLLLSLFLPVTASAQWQSLGPYGGDVRSLAQDPNSPLKLYLGTADSQIFFSRNAGISWTRLSAVAPRSDFVVDHIIVDPSNSNRVYAGVWSIATNSEGGVFVSTDAGLTWKDQPAIHGQSVRALAMAPGNHRVLVAGTLEGVFRTLDGGLTWKQISPPGHAEIRNVESIAVDPRNPDVIYAGTWHLPWKTTDGGKNWDHIQRGIVEDSDVFAIFIHPSMPDSALLSACTGIYQTNDGGNLWMKFKGIPSSSRRTRAIVADPSDPKTIYAGTTEGLWKTSDGGGVWNLMTSRALTVNAIVIDSKDHSKLYMGTDDSGFLISQDAARHFLPSNTGFTSRAISSVLFDRRGPRRMFVSVLYDHEAGGVFQTDDGGRTWHQILDGLTSTDVHTLFQAPEDNSIWIGTSDGAYKLDAEVQRWRRMDVNVERQVGVPVPKSPVQKRGAKSDPATRLAVDPIHGMGTVMSFSGDPAYGHYFYAASQRGLFVSRDSGAKWTRLPTPGRNADGTAVLSMPDGRIFFGTSAGLMASSDEGVHWKEVPLEDGRIPIHALVPAPGSDRIILMTTTRGLYRSMDGGVSWTPSLGGVPRSDISDIQVDARGRGQIFVTESYYGAAYRSTDSGETWEWISPLPNNGMKYRSILSDPFDPARSYTLFFREGLYSENETARLKDPPAVGGTRQAISNIHEHIH